MKAYFNGVELTQRFVLSDLSRPIAGMNAKTLDVPGMDGVLLKSANLNPSTVSFTLWPHWMEKRELRAAVREIAALMAVREPAPLAFSDDDGLYYMAVPNGGMDVREFDDAFAVDCSFLLPSPAMYGEERSASFSTSAGVEIHVGGSYPTKPVITVPLANFTVGGTWSVMLDNSDFMRLSVGSSGTRAVEFDCEKRTAKVDGANAVTTLESDWFELTPGTHRISVQQGTVGNGATVSWVERWLA